MNNKEKVLLAGVAFLAISITAGLLFNREKEKSKQARVVADEGYELASDIIFAEDYIKTRSLKYGPVLPA